MRSLRWLLALVLTATFPSTVLAQDRYALVIGNDTYENVSVLQKARNDAEAVAAALSSTGFDVTILLDADRRELFRSLNTFVQRLQPGDEAVFYFAGHGVEVEGRNYLLPTNVPAMRPGEERLLTSESLAADDILADMQNSGARVSVLILDACRDNPFPSEGTRSLGRSSGLARLEPPEGAFIMFSAGTGQSALDGLSSDDPNPNSVFTRALLPLLTEPGLPIHQIARRLRREVQGLASSVGHSQRPAYYDEVTGDFFFNEGGQNASGHQSGAGDGGSNGAPTFGGEEIGDLASGFRAGDLADGGGPGGNAGSGWSDAGASDLFAGAAQAQNVPRHITVSSYIGNGPCMAPPPFNEADWETGTRGRESSVGYIEMICGEQFVSLNGMQVRIRWFDGNDKVYTDCRDTESSHRCWVTLPQ